MKIIKNKKNSGIASKDKFHKAIERERERVNRNHHDVSMVLFDLALFKGDEEEKKNLISKIKQNIRSVDEIGWYEAHRVGVLLPYTSSHGAREFSARICQSLNFIMPDAFCCLFTYPLENDSGYEAESTSERQITR